MFNPKLFLKSIRYAIRGIVIVFRSEQSFRLQIVASVLVLLMARYFHLKFFEWIILFLLMSFVLTLEMMNSIIERITDGFKPRIHPVVRDIKDIMAGTVLIMSVISCVIGLVIFSPYILELVAG